MRRSLLRSRSKAILVVALLALVAILLACLVAIAHGVYRFATLPSEPTSCSLRECIEGAGRTHLVRITDAVYACQDAEHRGGGRRSRGYTYAPLESIHDEGPLVIAIFSGELARCENAAARGPPEGVLREASAGFGDTFASLLDTPPGPRFRLVTWGGRGDAVAQIVIAAVVASILLALLLPWGIKRSPASLRSASAMRRRAERAELGALRHELGNARGEKRAGYINLWMFAVMIGAGVYFLVTAEPNTSDTRVASLILTISAGFFVFFAIRMFGVLLPRMNLYEHGFVWMRGWRSVTARWEEVRAVERRKVRVRRAGLRMVGVRAYQDHCLIRLRDGRDVHLNESLDCVTEVIALVEEATKRHGGQS